MKTKYFLYARKSTDDEERQVKSIEDQLAELTEYANHNDIIIAGKFIESKTAKKPGREIFNQMIEKVYASDEPVGILAWHPDRLARNSIDGGQIIYLIDIGKIVSLRSPTFWFEPTPQGLFMLQVAFGQSKYYSDNLSENVKRGLHQKHRRGEWTTLAPFGYVNNRKTKNIDPDPIKSRIVKKMFSEFAQGKHSLSSLRNRLAFWGITSRRGTPISVFSIRHILTNKVYIGLIVRKGETFQGSFPALVSQSTFNKIQQILTDRSKSRRKSQHHHFPFRGLFKCGECGSPITAQLSIGNGGKYRHYRCTKRRGKCSQKYLRENVFAEQLKNYFRQIALPDNWTKQMFHQVEVWQNEKENSTIKIVKNLENKIQETQTKLDRLIDAFLDGTIDKEIYLVKKDELIRKRAAISEKRCKIRKKGSAWFEPLREFVETAHRAKKLAKSNDFDEINSFAEKIGSNHILRDRKLLFDFKKPFDLIPKYISTTARRNAAPKNSIPQKLSVENNKNRRLKSPINTGVDKIFTLLVGGKIPPDFSSKNRLNRQEKSIENGKKCGHRERREIVGNNLISEEFSVQNSESNIWLGLLYEVRTYFENNVAAEI